MTSIDRRGSIRLAMAAALAGGLATRVGAQTGQSGSLIAPPEGTMLYRRTVIRDLVDGRMFRVTRDFRVSFASIAEGYLVSGRQNNVAVDAPAALARFAELEEQRDETALFPIALNAFGQIQSPTPARFGRDEVEAAVEQALGALAQQGLPADEHEQAQRFVTAVHSAGQGITAVMPHDLFAPARSPRRTEQSVPLPDGGAGTVATVFEGDLDRETGLMTSAMREIVTTVDDSRRTTREEWSLSVG